MTETPAVLPLTQAEFDRSGRRMGGWGRTLVMGILNVTPDSFSDGGRFDAPERAISQALQMAAEGADFVDIGAESTRPGHQPVSAEIEIARLTPVLQGLNGRLTCPISIDTMKAEVADAAVRMGATIINDVWGFQQDPRLADVAARYATGVVLMHNRTSIDPAIDIADDIVRCLAASLALTDKAGIPRSQIALDPGIGFGKTLEQNIDAIVRLRNMQPFGTPILVGASRKSMIGKITHAPTTDERLPGTIAIHTAAILNGADIIRVHDVKEAIQAARVADRLKHVSA